MWLDLTGTNPADVEVYFIFCGATAPSGPGPPYYQGHTITLI
jgi:hypothetical protein